MKWNEGKETKPTNDNGKVIPSLHALTPKTLLSYVFGLHGSTKVNRKQKKENKKTKKRKEEKRKKRKWKKWKKDRMFEKIFTHFFFSLKGYFVQFHEFFSSSFIFSRSALNCLSFSPEELNVWKREKKIWKELGREKTNQEQKKEPKKKRTKENKRKGKKPKRKEKKVNDVKKN